MNNCVRIHNIYSGKESIDGMDSSPILLAKVE
jgi:hypothetical protein